MAAEQIKIDEKYTYQFDDGHVQILRYDEPWVGQERGGFVASNAWISAANELERLRTKLASIENLIGGMGALDEVTEEIITIIHEGE